MKSYFLASFSAFIVGWLTMQVAYISGIYYLTEHFSFSKDLMWFGAFSWLFNLAFNIIFIQVPRAQVKRISQKLSSLPFGLATTTYALSIFTLLTYTFRVLVDTPFNTSSADLIPFVLLLFCAAAVNGFTFGIAFHILWEPTRQE